MKFHLIIRNCICILFIIFCMCGAIGFCFGIKEKQSINRDAIETYFQNIEFKSDLVNVYGAFQKILGKRQIDNFTIFLNSYNKLVSPRQELSKDQIKLKLVPIDSIIDHCNNKKIPYYYIKSPLPIFDDKDLPYGVVDYSQKNADILNEELHDISTIDLQKSMPLKKEQLFYRTDHHWSGDTCFCAYEIIICTLNEDGLLDKNYTQKQERFERITTNGFLGSYGIKVGKYYAGEDVHVFYNPKFSTDIEFFACTPDGKSKKQYRGAWIDALINQKILYDVNYKNKYNAFLYGNSGENRIINHNIPEGKILLISHSYGRPLAQYLSLSFHEVRQIDPQKGRFSGNYLTYIDDYQPDLVLFLVEFEGEIIGEYRIAD